MRLTDAGQHKWEPLEGLPDICGHEEDVLSATATPESSPFSSEDTDISLAESAFAVALHMHQPMMPAGADDIRQAPLIGDTEYLAEQGTSRDRDRADAYVECYGRVGKLIRRALDEGGRPRLMLDYSGTLFWGLAQMGRTDVLERLRELTRADWGRRCVEWLGTMWGHAVAGSTPPADFVLHLRAWQHHFASLFGTEALTRVQGFSPPEMELPNHPDQAYAFVAALRECGYRWVLLQRDTVEHPDGTLVGHPWLPHRLVIRNLRGESAEITALIKVRPSDNTLISGMQPIAAAHTLRRVRLGDRAVPALVVQIGDGENGPEIVHEFPGAFTNCSSNVIGSKVVWLNGSEYLAHLEANGVDPRTYPIVQPRHQQRLWEQMDGHGPAEFGRVIRRMKKQHPDFHMDGASWDFGRSWVRGYAGVLKLMNELSRLFHDVVDGADADRTSHEYRNALTHLLLSQTSCFRYWGRGRWTRYAEEICRRGENILRYDF